MFKCYKLKQIMERCIKFKSYLNRRRYYGMGKKSLVSWVVIWQNETKVEKYKYTNTMI